MASQITTETRLVSIIREARALLEKLKVKNIELAALVPTLPKGSVARAEAIEMRDEVLSCIARLRAEVKEADPLAIRIQSHTQLANAVRALFGEDGLRQCLNYMRGKGAKHSDVDREAEDGA